MNEWALITGASAGIGHELAKVLAENNFNLVLVARNQARLNKIAEELRAVNQVSTRVVAQDLAHPQAAAEIFQKTKDLPVSVLVNNAGFGTYGPFATADLAVQTDMIQVNVVSLVQLTNLFLQPMIARNTGRILNVASTAAFQPGPLISVYYATKAFVYSFSYALAEDLAGTGISVTALCPGMTRTEFFERARMRKRHPWISMDARKVAEIGFRALMKGKRVVIPGLMNQILSFFAKRTPPRLTSAVVKRIH
jgi:short-subunit dehydrogenase